METEIQHKNELIISCENGDKKAQFAIYKQYYKAMFNTAYRIVNDRFEAEDIMQESFLAAFTKLGSFSGNVTFGAWLKRIVINHSLTALKKNKKIDTVSIEKVTIKNSEEEKEDYSLLSVKEILAQIAKLKPNYKVAITLHLIEGYDYEEIAEIMDISYENSRTTVSRAKNKLRQLLAT
ncbi:RNA polymerase sigma-70 factor, ECF subfamily [Lutibacter agarilyticus]|uniref:RNA polymerase sigma-70 factor, ECF subfamily n=1 Tax=Lutibacter agarilyticus TaxID=1109740 RepID=A0A238WW23_9FLAO|nr:RNA polymerase sigma factor [Lutibacter agarilyticus]SNR50676.1 RNA polymerase sigma-70 factor, ECF subfamily [Lutibacter agarilyticus]